jgi:hypothetical protein
MKRDEMVREQERAAIGRWFPTSPLGQLFDPGDGGLLRVHADAVPAWKQEAYALIDRFLGDSQFEAQLQTLVLVGLAIVGGLVIGWTGFGSGTALMVLIGLGGFAFHAWPIYRLWRYRTELAALRARIRASLAASAPLPRELGERFQRRNPWRIALQVWVFALVLGGFAAQNFIGPERIPASAVFVMLAAVGIAWGLYFLSRRVDLREQG